MEPVRSLKPRALFASSDDHSPIDRAVDLLSSRFHQIDPSDPLVYRKLKFISIYLKGIDNDYKKASARNSSNFYILSDKITLSLVKTWEKIEIGDLSITPPEVTITRLWKKILTAASPLLIPDLNPLYEALDQFRTSLASHTYQEASELTQIIEEQFFQNLSELYWVVKGDFPPFTLESLKLVNFKFEFTI